MYVCLSVCMYVWMHVCLSVCVCVIDYVTKKEKQASMLMYKFPDDKKREILELKHFNIFVSAPLNELFLLKKFSNL